MKRTLQGEPELNFERSTYHAGTSSKIVLTIKFLTFFLFFLQAGFSQSLNDFKPGSEPEGFGNILWGADFLTLKDMEYFRKDPSCGGIEIYRKIWNTPCPCGVIGTNIDYLFWNGKFLGILFSEEGFSGYEQLRKAVSKIFGEGKKPFINQQYYLWEGNKTFMALEYNPVGEKILFWMMGTSMLRKMEEHDKK